MIKWLELSPERRIEIINQVNARTGFAVAAIEKDWWVTVALKAVFDTEWAPYLVFKGGTSLSKGWRLITRFSEDIDLAMDRSKLGFDKAEPSPHQVKDLRKASGEFMGGEFKEGLEAAIRAIGIGPELLSVEVTPITNQNDDPREIQLVFNSLFHTERQQDPNYVRPRVRVEVGARSLKEPFSARPITSLVSEHFPATAFAVPAFQVSAVEPQRTILEKIFLLHEEKQRPPEKQRTLRFSRHLYDLYSTMDTEYTTTVFANDQLFSTVKHHRKFFNKVSGVTYDTLQLNQLQFLPAEDSLKAWEEDYAQMQENMIGSNPPSFATMMEGLKVLQARIAALPF